MSTTDLEDRVRRSLHAVADTLDDPSPAEQWGSVPLGSTAARPARTRRRVLVPAMVALTLALGLGVVVGRASAPTTVGSASVSPTAPPAPSGTDPATTEPPADVEAVRTDTYELIEGLTGNELMAYVCAEHAAMRAQFRPDAAGPPPVRPTLSTMTASAVLDAPVGARSEPGTVIVAATDTSTLVCAGTSPAVTDGQRDDGVGAIAELTDFQILELERPTPEAGQVVVDFPSWYSPTPEGLTGPGWMSVVGRAADDVDAITLVASDGSTADAQIDNGLFYARVEVGEDVELFDERLRWTVDGVDHESPVSLLDDEDASEICAREGSDCTAEHVAQLARAAETLTAEDASTGWAAGILVDGAVTEAEWLNALEEYAGCMTANGVTVTVIGEVLSVSAPELASSDGWTQPEIPACDEPFDLVSEARAYLDALERVQEG